LLYHHHFIYKTVSVCPESRNSPSFSFIFLLCCMQEQWRREFHFPVGQKE
jgi:hypothetical protein